MTKKADLQKELLAKVKPGTKPSHLKKSKSADDIPQAPPLPSTELATELKKQTDLNLLLQDQLKEKQNQIETLRQQGEDSAKQIEDWRKQLESNPHPPEKEGIHSELSQTELSQLDQSLMARHKNIKDWFTQYSKNKELDQELTENIDQASEELIQQDNQITNLHRQITKLKQTNQSLQKDLNLATKLAEMRRTPLPDNSPNSIYLKPLVFLAVATITLYFLMKDKIY